MLFYIFSIADPVCVQDNEVYLRLYETNLLLLLDNDRKLCVGNAGVEFTAHECGSFIVLDVAHIFGLGNLDVL